MNNKLIEIYNKPKQVEILAIGVHPDDVELSCSGTILHQIASGNTVGICDLTQGELGTRGTTETRFDEAKNAAAFLGVDFRANLGLQDGFMAFGQSSVEAIVRIIRIAKPKVVLANAIDDRHPDHGRASKLISDACFYAGLEKIQVTDDAGNQLRPHRPKVIYHYIQDRHHKPDFVVDISSYIDKKMESILLFKTQFFDPNSKEPVTPISGKEFLDFIKAKNMMHGRDIGALYGEGFTVERTIGVKNIMDIY